MTNQTTPAGNNTTSTRLKLQSTGVTAYCSFGPALYFHPDSEYGYDASFIPGAQKVIITPSHYAENLHAIYTHLPDAPAVSPGHPNEFMLPLTPVSPSFLHSCTTYITTQHGR